VNLGLTERRFILQHIHPENGKPSEILPHFFPISDIQSLAFADVETFGGEQACRLILRLGGDQHFRIRLNGTVNVESARALPEGFQSLTTAQQKMRPSPTQSVCSACGRILDMPSKFCPYCGQRQSEPASEPPVATATDTTTIGFASPPSAPEPPA